MPLLDPDTKTEGVVTFPSVEQQASVAPPSRLADLEHPWLGLESFREETRAYFFGRDVEIAEIDLRLRSHPLLVLYGRSGLGKTSILRAGLIPRLTDAGHRPAIHRFDYSNKRVGPAGQLLLLLFISPESEGKWRYESALSRAREWAAELREKLVFDLPPDSASWLWLRLHWSRQPPTTTHLILDQFEEVFTLGAQQPGAEDELRDALAILLQRMIPAPISQLIAKHDSFLDQFDMDSMPARVILSLRDDYVYALNRWKSHIASLGQNNFELSALRGPAAYDAVFKPGELRCRYQADVNERNKIDTDLPPLVSEEIAERIIRFIAKVSPDVPLEEIEAVPPILSLLCRELNERRFTEPAGTPEKPGAQITFREGETDIATIITTFYERCLAGRPEAVRIFIEEELVSPYSGARVPQDEHSILKVFEHGCEIPGAVDRRIASGYADSAKARACLEELVNQRLLTPLGGGDNPSYELIHDLLAAVAEKSRTAREERFEKEQADRRAEVERKAREDAEAGRRIERQRALKVVMTVSAALVLAVAAAIYGFVQYGIAVKEKRAADEATKRATDALDKVEKANAAAESSARKANSARGEAQSVMEFMLFDLPKKLEPIGRLDLLDEVNRRTLDYYQSHSLDKDAQRGYSAALRNKADILYGRGDLPGALDTYEKAFKIITNVANQDPANVKVKHDLWESGEKKGIVLLGQRRFQDAKKSLDDGLMISEDLTKKDPTNLEWQLDLSESYDNVGNALLENAQSLLDSAESYDSRGRAILSPEQLEEFQEKVKKAGELCETSGGIARRVADSEPLNSRNYSRARYLMVIGFSRRADVLQKQGDDAGSLEADNQCFSIIEKLVENQPGNAAWQRDLSMLYGRLAEKLAGKGKKGNYPEVVERYRNALNGFRKLAAQDPTNADWQYNLIVYYYRAAVVMNKMGPKSKAEAREFVEKGKEIKRKLEKVGMTPGQTNDLKVFEKQLPY